MQNQRLQAVQIHLGAEFRQDAVEVMETGKPRPRLPFHGAVRQFLSIAGDHSLRAIRRRRIIGQDAQPLQQAIAKPLRISKASVLWDDKAVSSMF